MKPLRLTPKERRRVARLLEAGRKASGLTRAELALAIGVHPSEASKILKAKTHLGGERLARVAAWLGMGLRDLLGRPRGAFPPEAAEMVSREMLRQSEVWRERGVRFVKKADSPREGIPADTTHIEERAKLAKVFLAALAHDDPDRPPTPEEMLLRRLITMWQMGTDIEGLEAMLEVEKLAARRVERQLADMAPADEEANRGP